MRAAVGGSYLSGKLSDIQIFGGTLGIQGVYNLTVGGWIDYSSPGLVALWAGPPASTVLDISGSNSPALNLSGVIWDADVMVAGMHAIEGTDLSASHGSFQLAGDTWTPVQWQSGDYTSFGVPGFNGRYWQSTTAGATATFANTSLTPGRQYSLAVCYIGDFDRTKNALYTIHDGSASGPVLGTVSIDQTQPCQGLSWDAASWTRIGTFTPSGTTITVVLTNKAGVGKLVADAIRFEGIQTPVMVKPTDDATITLPNDWAELAPDTTSATLPAAPGVAIPLVNRAGDILNQGVKTNPRTMKVGYNLSPVAFGGPSYYYRNRVKDQHYYAPGGTVSRRHLIWSDFRGQCDVTPNGLWTIKYKTLDGAGNHATITAGDSNTSSNVLGSTVHDNGETITGGVATRTYTVSCTPSLNSPILSLNTSGNIDYSSIAVYPPDPSNPSQSLAATGSDAQDVWHPNFLANMSVGFDSLRTIGVNGMYNAAVLSDYGMSTEPTMHYFDGRNRSGARISSISPIDNNPATDADGVVGYGYNVNLCFYKVRTETPHNLYQGDCIGFSGTNMPGSIPVSFPGHPDQGAYIDLGNASWPSPQSYANAMVVAVIDDQTFVANANANSYPSSPPPNGAPGTITATITPAQYQASDWSITSWVGYNMPLDHMVDLSNRTGSKLHFLFGHMITAQGASDLGKYFATHLNPGIGIRIEYSNEPFSFFPQFRYFLMQAQYNVFQASKGHPAPLGSGGNKDNAYAGLASAAFKSFIAGWTSMGRSASEVRCFYNYVISGTGFIASAATNFGITDLDVGYSPYYFNDYFLSGAGSYYPTDISAVVDAMDVEMWLDHFELMMQSGGWHYWSGQVAAGQLVNAGLGHWVDGSGNTYGTSTTPYVPGLKYVPGGANGSATIVTYEGGPQQIAMTWGAGSTPAGSYMMPTKCRQMYRHPRMKNVHDSCLQVLNDIGNGVFVRFMVGGFANQGMIRYWSDLDLYNQTYGAGDGSDGENNNILNPESNTAISPTYTAMRRWAGQSDGSVSPPVKLKSVTEATARNNLLDG